MLFLLSLLQIHSLLANVDQKNLIEACNGILYVLHMITSSVTLLWSVLRLADSLEKTTAGAAFITTINFGSTNIRISGIISFKLFFKSFVN